MFIRFIWAIFLSLCLFPFAQINAQTAAPAQSKQYKIEAAKNGQFINFTSAEYSYSQSNIAPSANWRTINLPANRMIKGAKNLGHQKPSIWFKLKFETADLGTPPSALLIAKSRERFVIYLNGVDIYRNFSSPSDEIYSWTHPIMVDLPSALLRPQANEILIRADTSFNLELGLGSAQIGSRAAIHDNFELRRALETLAPSLITNIIAFTSFGMLVFWLFRLKEAEFGWLALVGLVWCLRNLHHFLDSPPFEANAFWQFTVNANFVLIFAFFGFCGEYLKIANRRRFFLWLGAGVSAIIILRFALLIGGYSTAIAYLFLVPITIWVAIILAREYFKQPNWEHLLMLSAMVSTTAMAFHDLGMDWNIWQGVGFYIQPYGSLLVFAAFGLALGRRVLVALATVEDVNQSLEARVTIISARLENEKNARKSLEMAQIIEHERERIMREIHDGIGSNLVTAIALSQKNNAPPETIAILKRALTDLKVAVDSLDPIDGDVSALLASLRYRLEPDLNNIGVKFIWNVEREIPNLPWLDPASSLHILRLLQEAISNIISHAAATAIEVNCGAAIFENQKWVLIEIIDDGIGIDENAPIRGHGLANMKARATAINAILKVAPSDWGGTNVSLWLRV